MTDQAQPQSTEGARPTALKPIQYPLSQVFWPSLGAATVVDQSGQQLGVFPIEFLRKGRVCSTTFILFVLSVTFLERGTLQAPEGVPTGPQEDVTAGIYTYLRDGKRHN